MESKSFASFILFSTSFCALSASTLWIHNNTHSLVASSIFSNVDISLSVSPLMSSLSSPCINCSLNLLSYLFYSQSAALVCNLPIHFWAGSQLYLFSLQYWSDNSILLWHSLNFNPFVFFHAFFLNLWVIYEFRPSLPNQSLTTWTFSSSVNSYYFVWGMFLASISKLSNSTYLSWAFQLNDGLSRDILPCLYLCGSLRLVMLVAGLDPTCASLSDVITFVANWMPAWLTIVWIPSDSAISALFRFFYTACACLLLRSDLFFLAWDFYSRHHVILLATDVITPV